MSSVDRSLFIKILNNTKLKDFQPELLSQLDDKYANPEHGSFNDWQRLIASLPDVIPSSLELDQDTLVIGHQNDCTLEIKKSLEEKLKALRPWRKGPFNVFGIDIDAEWRSDRKWSRVAPHINDLTGKLVLDIGCGNGYYALRMQAMGADLVIGIDPTWLYVFQFLALRKYLSNLQRVFVLPFALAEMPKNITGFDTVFSMGVLYHQRQPQEHLDQVYTLLRQGGQFVLETLIIEDQNADVLVPNGRYANMRNVWMIPSYALLESWLEKSGFVNVQLLDVTQTRVEEQRRTKWMTSYSLAEALDPNNPGLTLEGHPAPVRASVIAAKPL